MGTSGHGEEWQMLTFIFQNWKKKKKLAQQKRLRS